MKTISKTKRTQYLKDEQFGSPINALLSNYLKKYTSKDNWADVSRSKNVGSSTVRDVVYRRNSLTEENSKAIIALLHIAIQNCQTSIVDANKAIKDLKSMVHES